MNTKRIILLVALLATVAIGCTRGSLLDSSLSEKEAKLSLDKTEIEVEAASFYENEQITDTVTITSSRSWSLAPVVEAAWMKISKDNGLNLGKVLKNWVVELVFEDNTLSEERLVDLAISIDGDKILLPIKQKAFSPVLELKSENSYTIPEVGDTITLDIRCNCNWTAQVDPSSTAKASIAQSGGYKSGTLDVIVKDNSDTQSGKEAVVIISAEGAADLTVNLMQDVCIPRLSIDAELSETAVLPVAGHSKLVFETNEKWTAALEEGASEGVTLSVEEGVPGDELTVYFPNATLEGASATVTITTASGLTESLTFVQRGCLFISFRKWADNNGSGSTDRTSLYSWETGKYEIPRYDVPKGDGNAAYSENPQSIWVEKDKNGNKFTFYVGDGQVDGIFYSNHSGIVIGSITQNPAFYIEFPAIEGKTLKEVKLMLGNSDVNLTNQESTATGTVSYMTDTEGNVLDGGNRQGVRTYQKTPEWHPNEKGQLTQPSFSYDYYDHTESMFHFTLTNTQPNTIYRYYGEYRQVIRWFILYYE